MKKIVQEVRKFNEDAGTELDKMWLSDKEINNEGSMLIEEVMELAKGFDNKDRVEVADALGDIIYVALGTCAKLGIDIERVLCEVIESNKSKYFEDGKLHKNDNGKILKGPNFRIPDLSFVNKGDKND